MNVERGGNLRRWSGRVGRFATRHLVGVLVLCTVAVAGFALLPAYRSVLGPGIVRAALAVLVLLSPALLCGAGVGIRRGVRAVRRPADRRRTVNDPQPIGRPIEQIAANLRRLLWQHDSYARSNDAPGRARGLEAAITDCATEAARALGVPHVDRSVPGRSDRQQLRRLLRVLAAEGLVLPATVGLMAPDSRR